MTPYVSSAGLAALAWWGRMEHIGKCVRVGRYGARKHPDKGNAAPKHKGGGHTTGAYYVYIWNPIHLDRIRPIRTYWYVPVHVSTRM